MKILWLAATPCGSVRRYSGKTIAGGWLISLEDEFKKRKDIELHVAYLSKNKEENFLFEGVHYYPICIDQSKYKLFRLLQVRRSETTLEKIAFPQIQKCINIVKPEVIHVHGTEGLLGIVHNTTNNIPVVFSIQGLIGPIKEKYFSGIPQNIAYKKDKFIDIVKGEGIKRIYESFCYKAEREKIYLNNAKYIFGRTIWDKYCTLALNPRRKYYIVNEILRPEFYSCHWKGFVSNKKIKIVSTISGGIYKGFETVLKSARILKQYSNIDFEWHIIGYSSDSKWVKICESITNIKSTHCNIVFHGRIIANEISKILIDSDIYVHVSHIENSPNSVCEAMLVGMPVIASFAGGTCSILEHEKEGILYQDGDPYILSGSIINLIQHPDLAKEYANNAYKRASLRHDKNKIVEEVIDGYKNIIFDFKAK
ncbi:colanic acid biosynthesis glycosyltransferase WcaL [uncultured Bacteroides sp.]|uniref:glycosyltransferase family 4 protein n=1 Tax=Bacteroides cellulolyticus TaxID=2981780 RepID=UPI000822889C|nr:glycosyltransferase [Bacteroides cellulolyticus]MCU6770343.1 glycosyltransferase family 4 protein [Bacteroides cellulolyticus]SCH06226.1 colanic acid biosynthesis glycosyltransferase WcaL [uncultured Bacteroides sp.]